jgi:hypothetical protein
VCDFGVSRVLDVGAGADEAPRDRSMTGGVGTGLFMSPEMISRGDALQSHPFACDVYSYALLAWQVLEGERPYVGAEAFSGMSIHQIKQCVVDGARPEIPRAEGEGGGGDTVAWPAGLATLVERCWDGNAADRPSFNEVCAALAVSL